jgi:hypothetical protein
MDSIFDSILEGSVNSNDLVALVESEIALWHRGDTGYNELHDYLGMTFEEYLMWVETNDIEAVIKMRRGLDDDNERVHELESQIIELTAERDRWIARNAELERRIENIRREAR